MPVPTLCNGKAPVNEVCMVLLVWSAQNCWLFAACTRLCVCMVSASEVPCLDVMLSSTVVESRQDALSAVIRGCWFWIPVPCAWICCWCVASMECVHDAKYCRLSRPMTAFGLRLWRSVDLCGEIACVEATVSVQEELLSNLSQNISSCGLRFCFSAGLRCAAVSLSVMKSAKELSSTFSSAISDSILRLCFSEFLPELLHGCMLFDKECALPRRFDRWDGLTGTLPWLIEALLLRPHETSSPADALQALSAWLDTSCELSAEHDDDNDELDFRLRFVLGGLISTWCGWRWSLQKCATCEMSCVRINLRAHGK